jgi:PHD/YefM family antitoxin component YafN of YafNO toxin-antitoxin module
MNTVSITEFKQNIGTYFDELISTKKPIYIKRRSHSAMIVSLDNLTKEEIKTIENIRLSKNF